MSNVIYLGAVEGGLGLPFEAVAAVVMVEIGIHWVVKLYAVLEKVGL